MPRISKGSTQTPAAQYLRRASQVIAALPSSQLEPLLQQLIKMRGMEKGVAWVIGNGGSQANAGHLVLHLEDHGIRAIDLLAETARITALSNDYDYAKVAVKRLRQVGTAADILIAISGSGDSPNVVLGLVEARHMGMKTYGLLGFGGGQALGLCDSYVLVPSSDYGEVEDSHSALIHAVNYSLTS